VPSGAETPPAPVALGSFVDPPVDGRAGSYAWGVATMPDGSVIVGDYWNARVLHFGTNGAFLGVLFNIVPAGEPISTNDIPYGLAVDPTVWCTSARTTSHLRSRWSFATRPIRHRRLLADHADLLLRIQVPVAGRDRHDGDIYVSDMYANKIFVFSPSGDFKFAWGSLGKGDGQFNQPRGIAFDQSSPQRLYVADANNVRVQVFSEAGQYLFQFRTKLKGNLRGLAVDDAGTPCTW